MPLKNDFYGVYKIARVRIPNTSSPYSNGKQPYIIKSLNPSNSMDAKAEFYMQGDPLTRILDIGHTEENITVISPILVPKAGTLVSNLKEGRLLLYDMVQNSYDSFGFPSNSLPVLEGATIDIGVDNSNVTLKLKSDGDPNNTTNVYEVDNGSTLLINQVGLNVPARIAKNWDFVIQLGDFLYYIESAKIEIKVKTSTSNFIGVNGYWPGGAQSVPSDGINGGVWQNDASYTGWQFPFISVGGIEITANGKAVLTLDSNNPNNNVNFKYLSNPVTSRTALIDAANVTLQNPGELNYTTSNFTINQIYKDGTQISVIPPKMTMNTAVIKTRNITFSEGKMTVDFDVIAFVGL